MSQNNIISNRGAKFHFKIEKGTYFPLAFYAADENGPMNLTGFAGARLTLRASESETATVLKAMTGTISAPSAGNDAGFELYYKVAFAFAAADTDKTAFTNTSGFIKAELLDTASRPVPLAYADTDLFPEVDQQ